MISIVTVTYNRKFFLRECLESLFSQDFKDRYEVIVIDNGSTDGTGDYISGAFKDRIKYVKNISVMNLSSCKEQGVRLTCGDVVAFTDDDCLVSENWLENIKETMRDYDVAGGIVLPADGVVFPGWWRRSLEWVLGINSDPRPDFPPLGSNVAFRRDVFKALSASPHGHAPSNECNPYGEDNERLKIALKAGFRLGINKEMVVYHRIPPERLKFSYFIKRSYREGRTWALREPVLAVFLSRISAFLINPFRFLATGDLDRFFRMVVSLGYMVTYLNRKR